MQRQVFTAGYRRLTGAVEGLGSTSSMTKQRALG